MPAPLASSANAQAQTAGGAAARTPRSEASKDFSQLLQGGAPDALAGAATSPPTSAPKPQTSADGNGQAPEERSMDAAATGNETSPLPPQTPPAGDRATDKDTPVATEDAPWPPLGLAGLVLAMPAPSDPAATAPAATGAGAALPATAGPGLPAPTPTPAPGAAIASMADSTPPAASAGAATTLPLPETVLPGSKHGDRDSNDVTAIGDRSAAPFLHAPAPAVLQDLKAALATGTAVFNGEPTPRPVFGDDGFDQAVGARLGWLADQKIGHAHIRLSPDDMGPVDVRLQLNGDKVHASFSSPHVDVRQALESSLPRLRELLGEQGFQLAHADVGHQAPGGDGNASGQAGGGGLPGDGEPTPGGGSVSSAQLIRQRGLLDAYA
ncbi:flagellar hook-length control protein FliK [Stenotrophomonas maltophilia]|uniref:flagellar hook-length control protein FliK n=1 Tax=Stenotrophomonas maltophilia TaxID=40324 RepID=UPI00066DA9C5|nr:flagellar hook-length control protein FliK [Stenotrophomonas maltophilia]MBH1457700.1 flagellar hook-length control protein FliK [Stenotrophomonas maltophilia]MBH1539252.1 flagellar hook-length control protein FliK [Stenotrophomonas maltophilia]MBH1783350.1 flagellar hook-length control protein FliK [Stenotrophomonas maltophilia]MBN5046464.1 flagellar hook-length control protein FliK [Stenotrophomonas maltophilia]MBN5155720.1 flagellar hook-length control protein FliK [Stenotrophomonas malt